MIRDSHHHSIQHTLAGLLILATVIGVWASAAGAPARAAGESTATLITANCAPVASAADGTMVWYSRNAAGITDAYIGDGNCNGTPLLPPDDGHRAPSDITRDGRYVLLTTAVGWDKTTEGAAPGKGSQNAIQLYDRRTGTLSTLLPGATSAQRGVIWPKFNAEGTKIAWAQMVKSPLEANFPWGDWELHVADLNLATATLTDNRAWRDPAGGYAMIEAYGWIPGTNKIIFQSTTRASSPGLRAAQLFTLPDTLDPSQAPTRISPPFAPVWPGQQPQDVFHEFASFAPGDPYTLYMAIGADTVGGDDIFMYDLRSTGPNGLLGQPERISYFGGSLNANWGTQAMPGYPAPRYAAVTTMAWVNGAWAVAVCPDMYCTRTDAYRVTLSGAPASQGMAASQGAAPGGDPTAGKELPPGTCQQPAQCGRRPRAKTVRWSSRVARSDLVIHPRRSPRHDRKG